MMDIMNKDYCTVIDCTNAVPLEVGTAIKLDANPNGELPLAVPVAVVADFAVTGPLFAHWINPRSTASQYLGNEAGTSYTTLTPLGDPDSDHFIPPGSTIHAVGGIGTAILRFFAPAVDADLAPLAGVALGTILSVSSVSHKLCTKANLNALARDCGIVIGNDGASLYVLVG